MSRRIAIIVLLASLFALVASASTGKHPADSKAKAKAGRQDPAFRAGYDDGYREGYRDAAALSNAYKDEVGALYEQASDGYTPQYGDREAYVRRFRRGYVAGYKSGWDFNSGQYCPTGCGAGSP